MNIVIPMAGLGQRFVASQFSLPKPLIKVGSKPMYRYVLECLPLHLSSQLIFLVRASDYLDKLVSDIKENYSMYNYKIIILERDTRGQAETVLKSIPELDPLKPTLIHNCDTYIDSSVPWESLLQNEIDATMLLFRSSEPRWSYAKLNNNKSQILDVREKEVISSYASTGTYFFKDTPQLLNNIQTLIDLNIQENNEYYLSGIYRLMIKQQKNITPLLVDKISCFGTPEDLVNSLNEKLCNTF